MIRGVTTPALKTAVLLLVLLGIGSRQNRAEGHSIQKRSTVCYERLGCFSNTGAFFSVQRPLTVTPASPDSIKTKFYLYTREEPTSAPVFDALYLDDAHLTTQWPSLKVKPTKLIIHGFLDNPSIVSWLSDMKDELLKHGDYNVIIVDWSRGNLPPYTQATANTRVVGAQIAVLLELLMEKRGFKATDFHLIGHSLGAHISGYAGERTPGMGRISGLDPAGPYFEGTDKVVRLDPSDAQLVDVIHTDAALLIQLGFGLKQQVGHMDFYPNLGHDQPGCEPDPIGKLTEYGLYEVDGYYHEWSEWSDCSVTCWGGAQSRDRLCVQPQHGGQDCQGPGTETQDCNTQPCPVDGVYLDWSAWGECSVSCGGGHQWRNRTCQPPQHGGQDCDGPDNVTQTCNTQPCPIDGVWLDWTDWSVCTVTCGGGLSSRSRQCQPPQHGGQSCLGSAEETRSCAETPCPIPGDWFPWTEWTLCGVTCGGGVRYRQRECDTESYGNLTAPCQGMATESEPCHDFPCSPLAATCSELAEKGLRESSIVDIDVDGPGFFTLEPIQVYCDMDIDGGIGVTVVGHDQEDRMMVQGLEAADGVRLYYNISFDHVLELVDRSASCKQYISWECFAALIHNKLGQAITGWLTREQDIADYFGGAAPGSRSCTCGMNSSCVVPELKCNCDANDEVWRQDDGFLTYKDDLPVYAFMAGDTDGKNENGYKQIGPLFCQGKETRTFNNGW